MDNKKNEITPDVEKKLFELSGATSYGELIKIIDMRLKLKKLKEEYIEEMETGPGSDIKDNYHTMSELYYNRLILFAVIVNTYKDKAWKSKLHADGTMFDDFFIVGIDTPEGRFSYHYQLKYWDKFQCEELEKAPEWKGESKEDIGRLMSLVK